MNKFIGMGRLTRDPDIRHTSTDSGEDLTIARYTLAIDRRGRQKEGQQTADFISCVAMGRQGEFAEKYLWQGTKIVIEGHIQTGSYMNKEGQKVYTTDVYVDAQEFAESKAKPEDSETQEEPTEKADDGFMNIPEGIENNLPFK